MSKMREKCSTITTYKKKTHTLKVGNPRIVNYDTVNISYLVFELWMALPGE